MLELALLSNRLTEHGVMFYTNIGADPAVGARKKIHGGSGIQGHGDSYGPGSMSTSLSPILRQC